MPKLANRTALITGASKGLGKAMALALGAAGARMALVSRNRPQLESLATEIRESGGEADVFVADISRESDVLNLQKEVAGTFQRLDILVNNAGINIRKPVTEFTLAEWSSVIETNLIGVFLMCRAFVPHMRGSGYGRIINMCSTMSHVALPHRTAYAASKAGVLGFTKALALELAAEGITVNGISPGPFATEMNTPLLENPELNRQFTANIPVGRWGKMEEIGQLAVYLCMEEAAFVTGTDILIDGGWCAR